MKRQMLIQCLAHSRFSQMIANNSVLFVMVYDFFPHCQSFQILFLIFVAVIFPFPIYFWLTEDL